jgi:thiol:disulfide interchange protein DsbC
MLDDAFAGKTLPKPSCETKVIDQNIRFANRIGVRGTPAIILPNGVLSPGYRDAASLIKLIDQN